MDANAREMVPLGELVASLGGTVKDVGGTTKRVEVT